MLPTVDLGDKLRPPSFAGAWRRAQPGQIVGPRQARPAGLRVAPVPPQAANLTGLARDADGMAGRDGGTGALIEPRNMDIASKRALPDLIKHQILSFAQWWVRLQTPHTQKI